MKNKKKVKDQIFLKAKLDKEVLGINAEKEHVHWSAGPWNPQQAVGSPQSSWFKSTPVTLYTCLPGYHVWKTS